MKSNKKINGMNCITLLCFTILFGLSHPSLASEKSPAGEDKSVVDDLKSVWEKHNPFKKTPPQKRSKKGERPEGPVLKKQVSDETKPEKKEPKASSFDNGFRVIPYMSLGNVSTEGEDGSLLAKNYGSSLSAGFGVIADGRLSNSPWAVEYGIGFLSTGADSNASSDTSLDLLYLHIPLGVRYYTNHLTEKSKLYVKGSLSPAFLLSAKVRSCNELCRSDDDLSFLAESESVSGKFKSYDLIAEVGIGADFLVFEDMIIDALWIPVEVSYMYGLLDISRSGEFGNNIHNRGVTGRIGLAIDF